MAIQNDNTVLNKGDLKAYHEKILPYLGGNFMMSTNNSDYYSTDEKVIGVWTDGRPIYQRSYLGNICSSTGTGTWTETTIEKPTNLDFIVFAQCGDASVIHNYIGVGTPSSASTHLFVNCARSGGVGISRMTIQYTKTTDTTTTALTTPGCYDINRPDLWPANKEIFFGNGLYGYRKTGTVTAASDERNMITIATNPGGTIGIVNSGGWIKWGDEGPSNDYKYSINTTLTNLPGWGNHLGAWSTIRTVNSSISLWNASGLVRTNAPYDIWVTYTK